MDRARLKFDNLDDFNGPMLLAAGALLFSTGLEVAEALSGSSNAQMSHCGSIASIVAWDLLFSVTLRAMVCRTELVYRVASGRCKVVYAIPYAEGIRI